MHQHSKKRASPKAGQGDLNQLFGTPQRAKSCTSEFYGKKIVLCSANCWPSQPKYYPTINSLSTAIHLFMIWTKVFIFCPCGALINGQMIMSSLSTSLPKYQLAPNPQKFRQVEEKIAYIIHAMPTQCDIFFMMVYPNFHDLGDFGSQGKQKGYLNICELLIKTCQF